MDEQIKELCGSLSDARGPTYNVREWNGRHASSGDDGGTHYYRRKLLITPVATQHLAFWTKHRPISKWR